MTEHAPCPRCRHGNPPKNRFCGWCGAPLTSSELVPRRERGLAVAGRTLPVRLKPVGKALAVGVAALAAEAGLSWLRRRAEGGGRPSMPAARDVDLVGQSLEEVLVRTWVGDSQKSRIFARRAMRSFVSMAPTYRRR
jgi:hypothetical protein